MNARRNEGWSVIELAIVLGVAGVLLATAIPGFTGAHQAARASEARMALLASLNEARTAAALKDIDVGMCPSADGLSCEDRFDWQDGWVVFADMDQDNARGPADVMLLHRGKLGEGIRVVTSTGRRYLDFQPNGGNAGSNATFTLCDERGPSRATAIAMGNAGSYRQVAPTLAQKAIACE